MDIVLDPRITSDDIERRSVAFAQKHWSIERDIEAIKQKMDTNERNITTLFEMHRAAPGNLEVGLRLGRLEAHRERLQDDLAAAVTRQMLERKST